MLVKIESLSSLDTFNLISTLDVDFASRLSQSLDLCEYSLKLSTYARFVVAYQNETITGLIAFYENRQSGTLYVPYFCTNHQYRRRGVGKTLIETLITYADNLKCAIELEVLKTNHAAIMLYKCNGFEVCSDGANKYRMIRPINSKRNIESEMAPLVSIACITYNHEPYIRQCLEGFVMQQTNFDFEIVIHDDASIDGTRDVILEYCSKYPHLFRTIFQEQNRYKEGKGIYARFVFPECRGKYIAICEGDDYWTDPLKLQKQVDILNGDASVSICAHNAFKYDITNNIVSLFNDTISNEYYSIENIIEEDWFIPTASIMCRRDILLSRCYNTQVPNGDYFLLLIMLIGGEKLYYSRDVMSVYRRHIGGVSNTFNWEIVENNINTILDYINDLTECSYEKSIAKKKKRLASLTIWEHKTKKSIVYKIGYVLLLIFRKLTSKATNLYYNAKVYEQD